MYKDGKIKTRILQTKRNIQNKKLHEKKRESVLIIYIKVYRIYVYISFILLYCIVKRVLDRQINIHIYIYIYIVYIHKL